DHVESGVADMMQGKRFFRQIKENCWDAEVRIPDYEKFNTQVQVVCTIPVLFSYWAKPKDGAEVSRFLNDNLAETIAPHPKNYIGLGTLPMQDTDLAIKELQRCKELGFPGVQIGSNINDKNLDEPEFLPIFEACQELGMAVFVHPWNMMGMAQMKKYWLPWLVGMPAETSRAICSMVFGGIFEKLPDLRVCFAHSGGSFIPTIGRIEHGFNCRPDLVAVDNDVNPRNYLGKFWVDCITHDADALRYIIDKVGSKKVCLGSDYPFPLGDLEIGKFIEKMGLPKQQVEDIYCNSTLEWLKLDANQFV
ncbi:MAG: amidohydrolase, partial [Flavobacteriales bacterium]|nr:amidohydrolase [Flavobacteriales bacterium]